MDVVGQDWCCVRRWAASCCRRIRGTPGGSTNWKFVATAVRRIGFQPVRELTWTIERNVPQISRQSPVAYVGRCAMTLGHAVLSATRDHTWEVNRFENLFYGRADAFRQRRSDGRCGAGDGLLRGGPAGRPGCAGRVRSAPSRSAPEPALPTPLPLPDSAANDTLRDLV